MINIVGKKNKYRPHGDQRWMSFISNMTQISLALFFEWYGQNKRIGQFAGNVTVILLTLSMYVLRG